MLHRVYGCYRLDDIYLRVCDDDDHDDGGGSGGGNNPFHTQEYSHLHLCQTLSFCLNAVNIAISLQLCGTLLFLIKV